MNNTLDLKIKMSPMILMVRKLDVLLIMKILHSNILFNDFLDKFMIYDYLRKKDEELKMLLD